MKIVPVVWVALTMILNPGLLPASTLILEQNLNGYSGCSDTTIYQDRPTHSDGGHGYIYSGKTQTASLRRGLLKFDIPTTMSASATINSVTLTLFVDRSRFVVEPYTLHRITRTWGEGTVDGGDPGGLGSPANPGDATWDSSAFGQTAWTAQGGDFVPAASSTSAVGVAPIVATFASTPQFVNDVQTWVTSGTGNYGWIIRGNEAGTWNAKRFISSENASGPRPRLVIDYTFLNAAQDWQLLQ